MLQDIVLVGGGGHCASCIEVIESTGTWKIAGIIDMTNKIGQTLLGYPILGSDADLTRLAKMYRYALLTIGQIKSVALRQRLAGLLIETEIFSPVVVASSSHVSKHAELGNGTIAMHRSFVNAGSMVGQYCILNTACTIEHDAVVGDYCHISTGTMVNGDCVIGDRCFVGSGAVIRNGIRIENDIIVGAGAVVVNDLIEPGVYVGNPARKLA